MSSSSALSTCAGASLLAADDYPANLMVLEILLEPLAVKLVTVTSGEEAVARAQQQYFDAILLDVHMSPMDGIDAALRIRSSACNRGTPILFMTGDELSVARLAGLRADHFDVLAKPYDPAVLVAKVKRLIACHRMSGPGATRAKLVHRAG